MTEICKFLKVEHGTGTLEEEDCVLVEECKEYDTALSGYIIVRTRSSCVDFREYEGYFGLY